MTDAPKVHLYSLSELKTTLDDHLPLYLSTSTTPSSAPLPRPKRFTPSHTHTYIRLALGYTAVAIAAYIFYLDYYLKIKFVDIKGTTALAVVAYFVLNGLLTLWLWFGERGLVFVGSRDSGGERVGLKVRSLPPHRKYDPVYRMIVEWSASNASQSGSKECKGEFARFFREDGAFEAGAFEGWVRGQVPLLSGSVADMAANQADKTGKVDGMGAIGGGVGGDRVKADEDTIVLGASGGSSPAVETPKKRGRPRKADTPKA